MIEGEAVKIQGQPQSTNREARPTARRSPLDHLVDVDVSVLILRRDRHGHLVSQEDLGLDRKIRKDPV